MSVVENAGTMVRPALRKAEFRHLQNAISDVVGGRGQAATNLSLGVSGGAPSERYVFSVTLDGAGMCVYRLVDEIGTRSEQRRFTVSPDEAARVFARLEPLVQGGPRTTCPADSLVGFVTIQAGRLLSRTCFPVWERGEAGEGEHRIPLPVPEGSLEVDGRDVPKGLTELFGEVDSLIGATEA